MANFIFNVSEGADFGVVNISEISTDCATLFTFQVNASPGDQIRMLFSQTFLHYDNLVYTQNGVDTSWDGLEVTLTYGTDLYISYSIGNSGVPGYFNKVTFEVENTTVGLIHTERNQRQNDSLECDNPTGNGGTYDELTDTPNTKIGNALKLVRVNAAETGHEYVDPGNLGNDLNYSQAFSSVSTVVCVHNLGKIPSVTVVDSSGNIVYGDITYTDLNNLTITFNTAFTGTVYLN